MIVDLDKLKVARLRTIDLAENRVPLLRRGIRKYRELRTVYPAPRITAYFIDRLFHHARYFARKQIAHCRKRLQGPAHEGHGAVPSTAHPLYAMFITGGLGDALMMARLARDIQARIGRGAQFDIYYHSPGTIEPFFRSLPGFRACVHAEAFGSMAPYYDFALRANQFVTFADETVNHARLVRMVPEAAGMFGKCQHVRRSIDKYIAAHPALDGAFADIATRAGHKRYKYLHEMLGLEYGGDALDLPIDHGLPAQLGLRPGHYLTIHDGWDTKFRLVCDRPTKALPLESWRILVQRIKAMRPDITIVQLGGPTGEHVSGVDVDLKQKLSFLQSMSVLAQSLLHIDTESGLVHAAACLGVRSVVMFGPTNVEWFSYPQNINVAPRRCGNCWWSTDSWMDVCAAGHSPPVCTAPDSIDPAHVAAQAVGALPARVSGPGNPT